MMENKKSKTRVVLGVIIVAGITVIIGTLSYAFFNADAVIDEQNFTTETGTMRITFADNDDGINANLNLGESATKKLTIENTGTLPATVYMFFDKLHNSFTKGSLTYTLTYSESEYGEYKELVIDRDIPVLPLRVELNTPNIIADDITIPAGQKYYYEFTVTYNYLDDVDQTDDLKAVFNSKFNVAEVINKPSDPNFAIPATTDEGIYALEDDYGTSYYYRGAVENNYIKYGKDKDGNDMYWRIVRINGDGSLRIIYDGLKAYANGTDNAARYAITEQMWNAKFDDAKYAGWMFGGTQGTASTSKEQAQMNETNSDAKTAVDNWYKENIVDTGYAGNVVDAIFCNDRTTPGKAASYWTSDTGLGYAKNSTAYGATARLGATSTSPNFDNPKPQFTCEVKNDAFTVNDTDKGNGALTYPVGLITADEIVTAGSGNLQATNKSYYLFKSSTYYGWSLSPFYLYTTGNICMFVVHANGNIGSTNAYTVSALAPVINLSAAYAGTLVGEGTISNPYREQGVSA